MLASSLYQLFSEPRWTKAFWMILGFLAFVAGPALAMKPTVTVNLYDYRGFTNTPVPGYPKEALDRNWAGSGLFQLHFDRAGSVTEVEVMISTDHQLLDQAAVSELNQWKCRPHALGSAMITMGFKTNKSDEPLDLRKNPEAKKKPNFLSAPHPNYPLAARRLRMTGRGLFMLHFRPDGSCDKVVPIEWIGAGGGILGRECVSTFLRWRCIPGAYKKIIIPISFTIS
jgi:TonB family protein